MIDEGQPIHLTQENFDDLHQRCSQSAADLSALRAEVQRLTEERDHERHEKETVLDALSAHIEWLGRKRGAAEAREKLAIVDRNHAVERQVALEIDLHAAEADLTRLREAIQTYGQHKAGCGVIAAVPWSAPVMMAGGCAGIRSLSEKERQALMNARVCDCGFSAVLQDEKQ